MKSVFFTGVGGQGKTTTANLIAPILDVKIIDGISRSNPYPMGSEEGQNWLAREVCQRSIANVKGKYRSGVYCRTPIDVYAYSYAYNKGNLDYQKSLIEKWIKSKPKIVYFPYLFKIEDDGFRPTDDTLAMTVDSLILEELNRYSIRNSSCIHIASNSVPEQRAKEIIEFLS
ncbi:hypothetical protein PBI_GRAYSON_111 [Rhodococcus phage Grayson]|nr:hypothetical protein PBI_GRAYSON_111 [Rhodococcus phage Grayson]